MNIATTRGATRSSLSLPNILTYARIAAVPVVVGCIYAQSIMDYPLWLRWVAVAVFIAAGVTDYLDGYYARIWNQQSAGGHGPHPWMVAVGGDRHPVPRDPGLRPARISRRAAGFRAGDQGGEMEDHDTAGRDRLPAGGRGRRPGGAGSDPDRAAAAVGLGDLHHLHRL